MKQISFPFYRKIASEKRAISPVPGSFSHDGVCDETERLNLERVYRGIIEETNRFSRKIVSFQANKTRLLHGWIKYREGFSAELVEILLEEFGIGPGQTVLDPFAGSCTTLLVAKMMGVNSVGVELLPHCHLAWEAKSRVFEYDVEELRAIRTMVAQTEPPLPERDFPHLEITKSAFPPSNERDVMAYLHFFETLDISPEAKILSKALLMSVLEEVSFTRKDGQYLRWDARAEKIIQRNKIRIAQGKKPITGIFKGRIPGVRQVLLGKFDQVISDIVSLQKHPPPPSQHRLVKGNVLYTLPGFAADSFDGVITSPPYANRYDYTRTYALELAFLAIGEGIFKTRQEMLSCTVENKPKLKTLKEFYASIGQMTRYEKVLAISRDNAALREVEMALRRRDERGDINNRGILSMIVQYFSELTFVFYEIYRVCKPSAYVAVVNDNVRYAGEVIPVDLISTNLAEQIGFVPEKVYVLPQRKGNSSQQMGKFGRRSLRKSITIWRKP